MPRVPQLRRDETPLATHRPLQAQEVSALLLRAALADPLPRLQGRQLYGLRSGEGGGTT